jgi:hypothetical protein
LKKETKTALLQGRLAKITADFEALIASAGLDPRTPWAEARSRLSGNAKFQAVSSELEREELFSAFMAKRQGIAPPPRQPPSASGEDLGRARMEVR